MKKKIQIQQTGNAFNEFEKFKTENSNEYIFGFFSYDLKNEIENLSSENIENTEFPALCFFIPEHVIIFSKNNSVKIISEQSTEIINQIQNQKNIELPLTSKKIEFKHRTPKAQYIDDVNALKEHICDGTIYEINYCQEFYAENIDINTKDVFKKLKDKNGGSFSAYFKTENLHALCTSPERFIALKEDKIISQPIKGTKRVSADDKENERLRNELFYDEKERAENVMIVDLVRNDLAKSAETGTVKVDELFGIYSFKTVHQMVSTITAKKRNNISDLEIIKNAFPMGSMTGAPKYTAMQLIEKYEKIKRGLYSGSIGYFEPNGNFDFNVVIRTLLYNADKKYLSYSTGSAITIDADAENEYQECLLKAKSLFEIFT